MQLSSRPDPLQQTTSTGSRGSPSQAAIPMSPAPGVTPGPLTESMNDSTVDLSAVTERMDDDTASIGGGDGSGKPSDGKTNQEPTLITPSESSWAGEPRANCDPFVPTPSMRTSAGCTPTATTPPTGDVACRPAAAKQAASLVTQATTLQPAGSADGGDSRQLASPREGGAIGVNQAGVIHTGASSAVAVRQMGAPMAGS